MFYKKSWVKFKYYKKSDTAVRYLYSGVFFLYIFPLFVKREIVLYNGRKVSE